MTSAFVQAGCSLQQNVVGHHDLFALDPAQCPGHSRRRAAGTVPSGGQCSLVFVGSYGLLRGARQGVASPRQEPASAAGSLACCTSLLSGSSEACFGTVWKKHQSVFAAGPPEATEEQAAKADAQPALRTLEDSRSLFCRAPPWQVSMWIKENMRDQQIAWSENRREEPMVRFISRQPSPQ